jgi:hypothetical protein
MDKRFIKKNIVLFGVLGISACIVVFLLTLIIMEHAEMQNYIKQTQEMVAKIDNLNSQRPAPVSGNDRFIREDIAGYGAKVKEIQHYFGHPFYDAKMVFVKELLAGLKGDNGEELSDGDKLARFNQALNTFWEAERARTARDQIYISFKLKSKELLGVDFSDYDKRWEEGLKKFSEEVAKRSRENLKENLYDIFLQAFGFKRTLSLQSEKYEAFAKATRDRLIDYFNNQKKISFYLRDTLHEDNREIGDDRTRGRGRNNVIGGTGSTFGFPQNEKILREQIPNYVYSWTIVDDLAHRIADSGVIALTDFSKHIAQPVVEGNYQYYRFQFTVAGSMAAIRQLMTSLNKAFDERRVYIIQDIELELKTDTLDELLKAEAQALLMGNEAEGEVVPVAAPANISRRPPRGQQQHPQGGTEQSREDQELARLRREAELEKAKPFHQRKDYAKIVFGGDIVPVIAKFTVDYVVYVNEEMK